MLSEQFHDPHFWLLLSAIIFALLAYKKGKAPILKLLDTRTARIQSELQEAKRLRTEAQTLLAETERKNRDAIQTAQAILDGAKEAAETLKSEAAQRIAESLARREKQLLDRIARAETAAVQELRVRAADVASRAAEKLLRDIQPKLAAQLVDTAVTELPEAIGSAHKLH